MANKKSLGQELNSNYSTTRLLSKQQPILHNSQDSKIKSSIFWSSENPKKIDGGLRRKGCFKQTLLDQPLISVITVVYNGEMHLEQTINSIINQTYNNVEYIVIDGGSKDGTLDIIRKYDSAIDYWISEPDKGIADAMNKGISLATGEYIVFIHADDYFYSNKVINNAINIIDKESNIIMFPVLFGEKLVEIIPRKFNWWVNFKIPACHQGILCKLDLFRNIGDFDTQFKIDMDYDFLLRAYRRKVKAQRVTSVLSVMRDTGISSRKDINSLLQRFNEERKVHKKNYHSRILALLYKIYWFCYLNYKKLGFIIQ